MAYRAARRDFWFSRPPSSMSLRSNRLLQLEPLPRLRPPRHGGSGGKEAASGGLKMRLRLMLPSQPSVPPGLLCYGSGTAVPAGADKPHPIPPQPITVLRLTDRCPCHWNRGVSSPCSPPANGIRASVMEHPVSAGVLSNRRAGLGGSGPAVSNGRARAAAKGQRAAGPRQTGSSGGGSCSGLRARLGPQVRWGRPGAPSRRAQGTARPPSPSSRQAWGAAPRPRLSLPSRRPAVHCLRARLRLFVARGGDEDVPRWGCGGQCPVLSRFSPTLEALGGGGAVAASTLAPWGCEAVQGKSWGGSSASLCSQGGKAGVGCDRELSAEQRMVLA